VCQHHPGVDSRMAELTELIASPSSSFLLQTRHKPGAATEAAVSTPPSSSNTASPQEDRLQGTNQISMSAMMKRHLSDKQLKQL